MKKPLLLGIISTVCVVIVAFVFAQVYPVGMISYWKFDEDSGTTAIDSVDANVGTLVYGPGWTTGQVDGALSFDGGNDYVRVLDNFNLDFGPGQDFSLEAWIKAKADQARWQGTILAKLNAPNQPSGSVKRDYGYSLMVRGLQDVLNEGKIGIWLGDGDGTNPCFSLYSVNTYDDDTWHHVVATIDRDDLAMLYIDGSEVSNADISHLSSLDESNFENLEIGREGVYDTYEFCGSIDEVAIYNRALSAEEVKQRYFETGGFTIDIKPGSYPNSVNLGEKGLLPVAILGSGYFDVSEIDSSTIEIGGVTLAARGPAKAPKLAYSFEDVNGDGYLDMMSFFEVQLLVGGGILTDTTTDLSITCTLFNLTPKEGTDSVNIVH